MAAGLTQLELSEKVGVSRSMIALYEIGKAHPSVKVLVKLARIFKVDLNEMKRPPKEQTGPPLPEQPTGKALKQQVEAVKRQIEKQQRKMEALQQELWQLLEQALS